MEGHRARTVAAQLAMVPAGIQESTAPRTVTVPCAARPSTGFVHLDGPCHCFVGGPPPEFAPSTASPGDLEGFVRLTAC